jgi:Zn-dependent oligopeptidase
LPTQVDKELKETRNKDEQFILFINRSFNIDELSFVQNNIMKNKDSFFEEYKTPSKVSPFNKIKEEHYIPAFKVGMDEQKQARAIISNSASPTFSNTVEELEYSRKLLSKGRTEDSMGLYLKFRGREPKAKPLLKRRGLN